MEWKTNAHYRTPIKQKTAFLKRIIKWIDLQHDSRQKKEKH